MKVKNIIAEALDLTALQGQVIALKKNYDEMGKSIGTNPILSKEYASHLTNMNASLAGLDKALGTMTAQQKLEAAAALKQQATNQQNQAKPGTTQSLSQQAVKVATPIPVAPTAPKPVVPVR